MPYIGSELSDNGYKLGKTKKTLPIVTLWSRTLAKKAEELNIPISNKYKIEVFGKFKDRTSVPDLHNLSKVICDALKKTKSWTGLGIDDNRFSFSDRGFELGYTNPELLIFIIIGENNE